MKSFVSEDYYSLGMIVNKFEKTPFKVNIIEMPFSEYLLQEKKENIFLNGYLYSYYGDVVNNAFHFCCVSLDTEKEGYLTFKNDDILNVVAYIEYTAFYFEDNDTSTQKKQKRGNYKTYVMIDLNSNLYKIGKAYNPQVREVTLQSEKPSVKLIMINDSADLESRLHLEFSKKRVRGEWFSLDKSDLTKILTEFNFKYC